MVDELIALGWQDLGNGLWSREDSGVLVHVDGAGASVTGNDNLSPAELRAFALRAEQLTSTPSGVATLLQRYWISWYHSDDFTPFSLHSPWWCSGWSDRAETICAAVQAKDADDAKQQITAAYDIPAELTFRFVNEKPADWSPFCERFPRAEWMAWPTP